MIENWLFEQYEMRNIIFIFKISHVIFAKCYYSPSGQYLKSGWVNRLSRPLNRFLPGGNRLNRYKNRLNRFWPSRRQSARSLRWQLRSLRCQFCSLCCQTARIFAQSTPFSARFYCAVWPETGWTGFGTGWTGFRFSGGRLLPFLYLSLSPLPFAVSFLQPPPPSHSPLTPSLHSKKKTLSSPHSFGRVVGSVLPGVFPPSSSISLGVFDLISGSRYYPMLFPCTRSYAFLIIYLSFVGYILV
jgi:hypothetical protein